MPLYSNRAMFFRFLIGGQFYPKNDYLESFRQKHKEKERLRDNFYACNVTNCFTALHSSITDSSGLYIAVHT